MFVNPIAWQLKELFFYRQLGYYMAYFSDDIKLQHYDLVQLQRALDDLSVWSHNNSITVNLSKCGFFSKNNCFSPIFLWDDDELLVVFSYTYLGFSYYPDGINFVQLTQEKCTKLIFSLTSIFSFADYWPAISAGLQIAFLCLKNSFACSPETTQVIVDLKALHKLALVWCIGIS
ncbi:hypothetical protein DSO57_1019151 [Entomophthora muscae]|uniref:Uncharacterized protein n=1 Tax=Entomophthora muscae TaxID=34485 RepID=A0ACC2RVA4_9FUNG|nr:hypothetical protein DSO57_1019151 [Entomophthora muscae]